MKELLRKGFFKNNAEDLNRFRNGLTAIRGLREDFDAFIGEYGESGLDELAGRLADTRNHHDYIHEMGTIHHGAIWGFFLELKGRQNSEIREALKTLREMKKSEHYPKLLREDFNARFSQASMEDQVIFLHAWRELDKRLSSPSPTNSISSIRALDSVDPLGTLFEQYRVYPTPAIQRELGRLKFREELGADVVLVRSGGPGRTFNTPMPG